MPESSLDTMLQNLINARLQAGGQTYRFPSPPPVTMVQNRQGGNWADTLSESMKPITEAMTNLSLLKAKQKMESASPENQAYTKDRAFSTAHDANAVYSILPDSVKQMVTNNPNAQKQMQQWFEMGSPDVIQTEGGLFQYAGMDLTEAQMRVRELVKLSQENPEAYRDALIPPNPETLMTGSPDNPKLQNYIGNRRALAAPTEFDLEEHRGRMAQLKEEIANAQLNRKATALQMKGEEQNQALRPLESEQENLRRENAILAAENNLAKRERALLMEQQSYYSNNGPQLDEGQRASLNNVWQDYQNKTKQSDTDFGLLDKSLRSNPKMRGDYVLNRLQACSSAYTGAEATASGTPESRLVAKDAIGLLQNELSRYGVTDITDLINNYEKLKGQGVNILALYDDMYQWSLAYFSAGSPAPAPSKLWAYEPGSEDYEIQYQMMMEDLKEFRGRMSR